MGQPYPSPPPKTLDIGNWIDKVQVIINNRISSLRYVKLGLGGHDKVKPSMDEADSFGKAFHLHLIFCVHFLYHRSQHCYDCGSGTKRHLFLFHINLKTKDSLGYDGSLTPRCIMQKSVYDLICREWLKISR